MNLSQRSWPLLALLGLLSLANLASASSVPIAYCASLLTADSSANSSIYQSDGLCYAFCIDNYAFAIVQDNNCWCSDYVPASSYQVDTSDCNTQCPGYPSDTCGGDGLYGYMQLSKAAAGTQGGDTTTATTTAVTTTQQGTVVTETVQNTVTLKPSTSSTSETSTTSTSTTSTETPHTTSTKDAATTDATTAADPSMYVSTITQGGSVIRQTVTVVPTATGTSDSANGADAGSSQKGLSTGAAVGTAVGVLGFVVIAVAAGFFLWFRRKKQNDAGSMLQHQDSFRGSSAGMMGTPRTEMASVWEGEAQSVGRRSSRLMPHDPRMDPFAPNIYGRFDNKSHESINTLRDDQDYSRRVLRTTNPDPSAGE